MSDISVPVIDRVIELAPARLLQVGGFTYIDKDKSVTRVEDAIPAALKVSTLTGLTDLLDSEFEQYESANVIVHVESPDSVRLVSRVSDQWGRRVALIEAKRVAAERAFKFNQYMPQEEFVIGLRTMFQQDLNVDDLVQIAGNLASQSELKQVDDGFSQSATVKTGVVRLSEKVIKPRVTLTPYRTFLEAAQPSSDYIFRIREGNQCALFDADAGNWRLAAIQNIRTWLVNRLSGSSAAGVGNIPVIA